MQGLATDPLAARLEPAAPGWESDELATAASLARAFERHTPFTVGAEEELLLIECSTGELAPVVDVGLRRTARDPRFGREIHKSQVEIVTPVVGNAQALGVVLAAARFDLARHLEDDVGTAGAGTDPWGEDGGDRAAGARYAQIADEFPMATSGSIPCGLHVHVAAAGGGGRAVAVFNALVTWLLRETTGPADELLDRRI